MCWRQFLTVYSVFHLYSFSREENHLSFLFGRVSYREMTEVSFKIWLYISYDAGFFICTFFLMEVLQFFQGFTLPLSSLLRLHVIFVRLKSFISMFLCAMNLLSGAKLYHRACIVEWKFTISCLSKVYTQPRLHPRIHSHTYSNAHIIYMCVSRTRDWEREVGRCNIGRGR